MLTLFPFSISALSHTATSPANFVNSRTWVSSSLDHLFTISSMVLPRNIDGGGTAIVGAPGAVDAPGAPAVDAAAAGGGQMVNISTEGGSIPAAPSLGLSAAGAVAPEAGAGGTFDINIGRYVECQGCY